MSSIDYGEAGRLHLARGEPDRAARQFELALEACPHSERARELLIEAHRCRNTLYWALRGYWRWSAPKLARWMGLPLCAGLVLVIVVAECFGGFAILPGLPQLEQANAVAQSVELFAWLCIAMFIALREHKWVWIIDRVTTAWLVPAEVRERCLDAGQRAECRRAVGYSIGGAVFLGGALASTLLSTGIERYDDFALGMLALAIPIGLAASLPSGRTRSFALVALAIAAAGPLFAFEPGVAGWIARLSFLIAFIVATPALIVLHARAARPTHE